VFCSGKVYFDLLKTREERRQDVALVRIEQLYPFPSEEYGAALGYPNAREIVCVGGSRRTSAWYQIRTRLQELASAKCDVLYAGRAPAAAPATCIGKIHTLEQQTLVAAALHATTTEDSGRDTQRLRVAPAAATPLRKSS
jgi:2-oxoglutarate dehydrogenase E1 component